MHETEEEIGRWELRCGTKVLARLNETSSDFPWVSCSFRFEPEFEAFRQLFTRTGWINRERELHETIDREGIFLFTEAGQRVSAFTLIVNGDEARLTFTRV